MRLFLRLLVVSLLATLNIYAQQAENETKHFEKDGLEFDYPTAWNMSEGRAGDLEYVELATDTKTVQLIIHWHYNPVLDCQFEDTRKQITRLLADRIATQIHTVTPPESSWLVSDLGRVPADEIHLSGLINNKPVTANVYSPAVKRYFLNLVYLRSKSDANADTVWNGIRSTLKFAAPLPNVKGKRPVEGGVLNGKALHLAQPPYPAHAKAAHVDGTVVVQVLINESGTVIGACILSGDPRLREVSVEAAWKSRFTTTRLSGQPIQVTGIIMYRFIAQ